MAELSITDVRQKYPQYGDLTDEQLADALHTKFYADMPAAEFRSKIGLKPAGPAPATAGERTNAAIGGLNRGIAGLAGLPIDTVENIINLGIAAYGTTKQAITGQPGPDLLQGSPGGSQSIARGMEAVGFNASNPRPDDPASRMLNTAGVVVGGGPNVRAAVPAAAAAVAGEVLGPEWKGVGAMTPGAIARIPGELRSAANAGNPAQIQRNAENFEQAGTTASVGQATRSTFFQSLENIISKLPGGAGIMKRFGEQQQSKMGETLATGGSAEAAGRAIEKGVTTGEGGFLERTKATWQALDARVAAKIPQGAGVAPTNTVTALDELTAVTQGAEKTTGALVNPKVAEIKQNIAADLAANNGQLPYDALRALRSRVGSMLDDSLVSGIPGGELKKLYGALSKDLEAGANANGAGAEFARQNAYYKARMDRIETVLDRVLGKNRQPEEVFQAINPTNPDQANVLRATMRSLEPGERQVVTDAIVNRLGRATPGRQNDVGDQFSSQTFLTNWNRMSPAAKAQIFPDATTRQRMDSVAAAAHDIRESATRVFNNPSGSAGAVAGTGYTTAIVAGAVTGQPAYIMGALGAMAGANVGARMLTSPKVVAWLAQGTKSMTPREQTAHLARLGVIFSETKDEALRDELGVFMQAANAQEQR